MNQPTSLIASLSLPAFWYSSNVSSVMVNVVSDVGEAEVAEFQFAVTGLNDIIRLDIAMYDSGEVQWLKTAQY